jgi:hypothetical protein
MVVIIESGPCTHVQPSTILRSPTSVPTAEQLRKSPHGDWLPLRTGGHYEHVQFIMQAITKMCSVICVNLKKDSPPK